jgi:hypothetical protein
VAIHYIGDDLLVNAWYHELVAAMLADVERYLARWAAFSDAVGDA